MDVDRLADLRYVAPEALDQGRVGSRDVGEVVRLWPVLGDSVGYLPLDRVDLLPAADSLVPPHVLEFS